MRLLSRINIILLEFSENDDIIMVQNVLKSRNMSIFV